MGDLPRAKRGWGLERQVRKLSRNWRAFALYHYHYQGGRDLFAWDIDCTDLPEPQLIVAVYREVIAIAEVT